MDAVHTSLAAGRWQTFTLSEQLGNIGSEVGRALNWHKRSDESRTQSALDRALELFDLTIADTRWKVRLREILRAREVACDYFYGGNTFCSKPEQLESYFTAFALLARRNF
ncbi:hypothetical protein HY625_01955 [Candidatus Uhrbacteria bacterium]|nr:hypothetical protein [Candidatus Uhrbacteria bacterium]